MNSNPSTSLQSLPSSIHYVRCGSLLFNEKKLHVLLQTNSYSSTGSAYSLVQTATH